MRRIDLAERGDIRDLLLDERRAVGARAVPLAELIDVVNKAFRLGIDVGFQTEEALLPGAGADVDQGAVARQLIGERTVRRTCGSTRTKSAAPPALTVIPASE